MTASREDLREDLRAMVAAAPELSEDERDHLADVFLDRLENDYHLVPRGQRVPAPAAPGMTRGRLPFPFIGPAILLAFGFMAVLWLLATSVFAFHHAPVFLFVILFFVALRLIRPWGRRRMYP